MDCTISRTTPDDDTAIENFIHDNFLSDIPLVQAFGLEKEITSRPRARTPSVFNLKAVDGHGNLVGVAINRFNHTFEQSVGTSVLNQLYELLAFTEREADLTRLPENTIELRVLSVRKEWRGKGVARRLAEESARVARSLVFTAIKVCCTSEFTAKLARSLGWREVYRLAYTDYPALSGREVKLKPNPPHDYLYYYVNEF